MFCLLSIISLIFQFFVHAKVYATADNSMTTVMQHNSRVNQADFVGTEGKMVSVCEDKALRMFNAKGEMV
jgi:hypothetical protein